jgi:curved DNA-binding protein CbpA
MSKKKKKRIKSESSIAKEKISILDDPYWKVSSIFVDMHRVGNFISKFERFEVRHPEWVQDLMGGIPTYYCVLGVEKGATKSQIEQAYEKKLGFSSYNDEVIEEAFDVLSNPGFTREYNKLLFIFEQITKSIPPHEKNELIKNHVDNINTEKEYNRMGSILEKYKWYYVLYMQGMPDLYEVTRIAQDSPEEAFKKHSDSESGFMQKIFSLLSDKSFREDYNFLIYFANTHSNPEILEEREIHRRKWEQIDNQLVEKIIFNALNEPFGITNIVSRSSEIINNNHDWSQYLPKNEETFLSVLGLERNSLSGEKKEVEKTLREKYRYLEKTAKINLAYSVLKNTSLREDYLWLLENQEMVDTLNDLFSAEFDLAEDDPDEIEWEDNEIPHEIIRAFINSILNEEEKPKKKKTKKRKKAIDHTQQTLEDMFEI